MKYQVDKKMYDNFSLLLSNVHKTAIAARDTCAVYGDDLITDRKIQKWFSRFKEAKFELGESPLSDRPVLLDENQSQAMIKEEPL